MHRYFDTCRYIVSQACDFVQRVVSYFSLYEFSFLCPGAALGCLNGSHRISRAYIGRKRDPARFTVARVPSGPLALAALRSADCPEDDCRGLDRSRQVSEFCCLSSAICRWGRGSLTPRSRAFPPERHLPDQSRWRSEACAVPCAWTLADDASKQPAQANAEILFVVQSTRSGATR